MAIGTRYHASCIHPSSQPRASGIRANGASQKFGRFIRLFYYLLFWSQRHLWCDFRPYCFFPGDCPHALAPSALLLVRQFFSSTSHCRLPVSLALHQGTSCCSEVTWCKPGNDASGSLSGIGFQSIMPICVKLGEDSKTLVRYLTPCSGSSGRITVVLRSGVTHIDSGPWGSPIFVFFPRL